MGPRARLACFWATATGARAQRFRDRIARGSWPGRTMLVACCRPGAAAIGSELAEPRVPRLAAEWSKLLRCEEGREDMTRSVHLRLLTGLAVGALIALPLASAPAAASSPGPNTPCRCSPGSARPPARRHRLRQHAGQHPGNGVVRAQGTEPAPARGSRGAGRAELPLGQPVRSDLRAEPVQHLPAAELPGPVRDHHRGLSRQRRRRRQRHGGSGSTAPWRCSRSSTTSPGCRAGAAGGRFPPEGPRDWAIARAPLPPCPVSCQRSWA